MMLNYKLEKINKLDRKVINQLIANVYKKYAFLIDKKQLNALTNIFIKALRIKCKKAIIIYDGNENIICFCPYYFTKHNHDLKLYNFLKENENKITNPALKKLFLYFWIVVSLIEYEEIKENSCFLMTFPLFNFGPNNKKHIVRKLLLHELKKQLKENNLSYFYFCNIQDVSSSLIVNKRSFKIVYHQNIKLFKKQMVSIKFYKWIGDKNKILSNYSSTIDILDNRIPIDKIQVQFYPSSNLFAQHTLFMIHGIASTHKTWNIMIGELQKYYDIYAIDLPLHGESNNLNTNSHHWDIFKYAILIKNYIKMQGLKNVVVWGHSMGGAIAACVSELCGEIVNKVILESPYSHINENIFMLLNNFIIGYNDHKKYESNNQKHINFISKVKTVYSPITMRTISLLNSLFSKRILEFLDFVYKLNSKQTLILFGEKDYIINCELSEKYFSQFNNYDFKVIKDCWHSPHHTFPILILDYVKKFLF